MQLKPHTIELNRSQLEDLPDLLRHAEEAITVRVQEIIDEYGFKDLAEALEKTNGEEDELDELGIEVEDAEELRTLADLQAGIPELRKLLEAESNHCDRCGQTDERDGLFWEEGHTLLCEKCSLEIGKAG
jgi:hypothetical protein